MIQLHPDYLLVQQPSGEMIPCSADMISFEVTQDPESTLNPDWIHQAALAVMHYFKHDLSKDFVSIEEFSTAMERVILALCYVVRTKTPGEGIPPLPSNLETLVSQSEGGFELAFFQRLRAELVSKIQGGSRMLLFEGLRPSVKQLLGVKRWSSECQKLNDQIVEFLRRCLSACTENSDYKLVIK